MATKKTDSKKPEAKKARGKKPVKGSDITLIEVPVGGQVIGVYELFPEAPKDGKAQDWKLVDTATGKPVKDLIGISFDPKSSRIQTEFERAVLVIKMVEEDAKGRWTFALNGIDVCSAKGSGQLFETEVVDFGRTLLLYAQSFVPKTKEQINFSFVAAYTETESGKTAVYESKDPGVVVGRPAGP